MATSSSVSNNIIEQQSGINSKKDKYINIKNAVKILDNYSNWQGFIKLYTEVESNFEIDDIVYITYTEYSEPSYLFNLENPDTPYTDWYTGYKILYVNKSKNEIVINREYNDITSGSLLKFQYLSKVSVRNGTFTGGVIDGLVFFNANIYSGVSFTQGIFKYCNISDITFNDKYKFLKTLYTTNSFTSKKTRRKSSTATVFKSKKYYYNEIDQCHLLNCNIKNGKFDNSTLIGTSGVSYILDGSFSDCTISGYTIYGGHFTDCIIESNCIWNSGFWNNVNGTIDFRTGWKDGTWNKGSFIGGVWSGGTFNAGIFSAATWVDGTVNYGNFYYTTWYNGLVRNANFENSIWLNGVYNQGNFINSEWSGGTFNKGTFLGSTFYAGQINNGTFTGSTIKDGSILGGNTVDSTIDGGKFYNDCSINNCTINYSVIHNGTIKTSTISNGKYYNGFYEDNVFDGGNIRIHNGLYKDCSLIDLMVLNGSFFNCDADNVSFRNGVFTEGTFKNGYWYNGTWNDGIFNSEVFIDGDFYGGVFSGGTESPPDGNWTATWSGGTFHYGWFKGVIEHHFLFILENHSLNINLKVQLKHLVTN